ncbi:hypothetical protein GON01_00295 [Sphingomonas sp. MAH-20]|uniref:Uncharacterized protein n=1 Tax=Sphingomonas horti TaxID=2682842 RepID=A0A6I4IXX2_9SPHN|nr:hypothetical protein [Sphingomonas horti]
MGDAVRNAGGGVAGLRALGPDLLQPVRNQADARADFRLVAAAEIFEADIDDAAGVDHVIGREQDAARVDAVAVLRRRKLVVRAARHHRRLQRGDALLGQHGAQRVRADHVRLDAQDLVRLDRAGAELLRQRRRTGAVDVRQRQLRAFLCQEARQPTADAAQPLHRDMDAADAVLAEAALDRGLHAQEHAIGSERPRIAAGAALRDRKAGNELGRLRYRDHVVGRDADVLRGHVAAAQRIHGLAERLQ